MALQPVRGTRDLRGDELKGFLHIVGCARDVAALYGFEEIETPIFESTDVFARTLGDHSDIVTKEMYTFTDKSGDSLTLRPEGTAPVVRSVISESLFRELPLKYFYQGPMFRHERPQKGRYRQFYQIGVELIGVASPVADALTPQVMQASVREHRALARAILDRDEAGADRAMRAHLDRAARLAATDVRESGKDSARLPAQTR